MFSYYWEVECHDQDLEGFGQVCILTYVISYIISFLDITLIERLEYSKILRW